MDYYSCEAQLTSVTDDILHNLDHHKQVDLVFLDFHKAFDTVPHRHLLLKLSTYGIQSKVTFILELNRGSPREYRVL